MLPSKSNSIAISFTNVILSCLPLSIRRVGFRGALIDVLLLNASKGFRKSAVCETALINFPKLVLFLFH